MKPEKMNRLRNFYHQQVGASLAINIFRSVAAGDILIAFKWL